ncbi:MAG TPA: hypothetical protein VMJ14_16610 [Burkholderiales bacterium]|nr:hypothetical protein [Burkholderiales bacterium]
MNARKIALGLATGAALLAAAPAFAHDFGWRARPYSPHYYRAPAYAYYPARPVVVAPPPVVYAPAPVYYAPPAPVVYGTVPIAPGFRVNFGIRL